MRWVKFLAVFALTALPLICSALTVPFFVKVPAGSNMNADYSFDPAHQTLVCTSISFNALPASVYWNYNGIENGAVLSPGARLTLKGNSYPEGYFADPKGDITIDNTLSEKKTLVVNCEYHTWD